MTGHLLSKLLLTAPPARASSWLSPPAVRSLLTFGRCQFSAWCFVICMLRNPFIGRSWWQFSYSQPWTPAIRGRIVQPTHPSPAWIGAVSRNPCTSYRWARSYWMGVTYPYDLDVIEIIPCGPVATAFQSTCFMCVLHRSRRTNVFVIYKKRCICMHAK